MGFFRYFASLFNFRKHYKIYIIERSVSVSKRSDPGWIDYYYRYRLRGKTGDSWGVKSKATIVSYYEAEEIIKRWKNDPEVNSLEGYFCSYKIKKGE